MKFKNPYSPDDQAKEPVRKTEAGKYGPNSEHAADVLADDQSQAGQMKQRRKAVEEDDELTGAAGHTNVLKY